MPVYHSKKGSSNKFWSYEINGSKITYKWGRVGQTGETLTEAYDPSKLQKKIRSKTAARKGYELIDEKKLEKETTLAEGLGFRTKIAKMDFVSVFEYANGRELRLDELHGGYDPDEYIFVNLLDSWDKSERWLLISTKHGHRELSPTTGNKWRSMGSAYSANQIATTIVDYLQDMIEKFTTIVTASFGSLGGRALDDDTYQAAVTKFTEEAGSNMDTAVVGQIVKMGFASMGARALDI